MRRLNNRQDKTYQIKSARANRANIQFKRAKKAGRLDRRVK